MGAGRRSEQEAETQPDRQRGAAIAKWRLVLALGALAAGLLAQLLGEADVAIWAWRAGALPVLATLVIEIASSLRRGDVGLDIVAALSMSAALAVGETLAAAVVAVMYAGGQYLEQYAERRARREMTALLERAPRTAIVVRPDGLAEVDVDTVLRGDRLLVRRGDIVAADGVVRDGVAIVDVAALTGEPLPMRVETGGEVLSGAVNVSDAFEMDAARAASASTYAGIVRLVAQAAASKAPMSRLADRFALGFLVLTVVIAGLAWAIADDPVRAVAVLVVATPCPLILAVPVALVAGMSRAARYGVLVKGAAALEVMARVKVVVFDKTGTLTEGRARLVATHLAEPFLAAEVLRLAASLDQASKHPLAQALAAAATTEGLTLAPPSNVREAPGEGLVGEIEGREVILGGRRFVRTRGIDVPELGDLPAGAVTITVAVNGHYAGTLVLEDVLRPNTEPFVKGLRRAGVARIVMATGDQPEVATAVAAGLGLDDVRAGLSPDQKVLIVVAERKHGPVMMVGDGVNDAPALAAADLGVALGARGTAASVETADVVLLVDALDRLLPGLRSAQRARNIALQSVAAGIGLSLVFMVVAALGHLTPVEGALLQEAIDVAVILNALRALGEGSMHSIGGHAWGGGHASVAGAAVRTRRG